VGSIVHVKKPATIGNLCSIFWELAIFEGNELFSWEHGILNENNLLL
jgi:hypothetical protein